MVKKSIADILIAAGVANTQQILECQQAIQESGQSLEECLLENKFVSSDDVARAYADYASLPFVQEVTDKMADIAMLGKVPLHFLRDNAVVPVMYEGKPTILTSDPIDFQPLDELSMLLGGDILYAVCPKKVIIESINKYYTIEGTKQMIEELESAEEKEIDEAVAFEEIEEKDILAMASEAPIIKLVNHIFFQAVKRGASEIHIEPFEKEIRVRYRIDGIMYSVMSPPKRVQSALISRIKIMANLDIAEKRVPQDGRIQIKVADKTFDIRVSILPVAFGERVVMRLLDKSRTFTNLEALGFSERDNKVISQIIRRPNGIIFVTGPTGSGKTTTLYSVLGALNKSGTNIVTVEDPIEYQMTGVSQVQVREKVGMTFAAALRSILRQDPDIIMIGETRDHETGKIAIQAALTGHLVLSTLHTNDAPSTITRLTDMGIEPFLIASSVIMAMAQRLIRRLCDTCKKEYSPPTSLIERLGITAQEAKKIIFYDAQGCDECSQSGYKGRIAIFEVMEMTDGIAKLTMERADTMQLKKQAIDDGMTLLIADGVRKIEEGITTIEEVLAVATME